MLMRHSILACCATCALAGACSNQKPPKVAEKPMTPAAASAEPRAIPSSDADEQVDVHVGKKIQELCYLPLPHFSFDSSALSARGRDALADLADCFVHGAAANERLKIVGHADPRGTFAYNLALGERRAARVADYLKREGVANSRIDMSSRGELDAKGTDETSYAEDRRVGIFLAD
jgi:peptidoglycan-associated lipoprotein